MNIIEEHVSPDGFLRLIVARDEDGDISIGFDRFAWHTHPDVLAPFYGPFQNDAIRNFIDRIIGDDEIIVVSRVNGEVCEVWPTEDPKAEFKYKPPEESLEFRLWSGVTIQVEPSG